MELTGTMLLPGAVAAPLLLFDKPISFWGGIDPERGVVTDPRHPQHGASIGGRLLALPATIGSSASSAILLELIARGQGPAGLILTKVDAILLLGAVVAAELGHAAPPALRLSAEDFRHLTGDAPATLLADGRLRF